MSGIDGIAGAAEPKPHQTVVYPLFTLWILPQENLSSQSAPSREPRSSGLLFRPMRLPEAVWACLGALALILMHLISWDHTLLAVSKGIDVYLFLAGMMLLAELARWEGVFDWLAAWAVRAANKSASRLFLLIYCVGTIVTVFLSNDATAVVITPAVYAAVRKAKVDALPYLLACAFIANAASFVLPISNPANIVVFDGHLPP